MADDIKIESMVTITGAEYVRLMAENARLRTALKEIRDAGPMTLDDQRWRVALAALGGEND